MEELFKWFAASISLGIEVSAVLIVTFGAAEALYKVVGTFFVAEPRTGKRRGIWLRFALWLLLGLEFELAADVVRTAISPTWTAIGQLGAIGAIRTLLNYFLEEDIDKYALNEGKPADGEIGEHSMLGVQEATRH